MTTTTANETTPKPRGPVMVFLDFIEWLGNKLPDPAVLFVLGILIIWTMSAICSSIAFTETLPGKTEPIQIVNMLTLEKLAEFLSTMTESFVGFHPLGVVLVAMLGVGVADHSGFISALLKTMLTFTPRVSADTDGGAGRCGESHRSGCRIRGRHSSGGNHLLCGRSPSAGRNCRRVCRRQRRLQCESDSVRNRSAAGGSDDNSGCSTG